jgi:hypothetical protein
MSPGTALERAPGMLCRALPCVVAVVLLDACAAEPDPTPSLGSTSDAEDDDDATPDPPSGTGTTDSDPATQTGDESGPGSTGGASPSTSDAGDTTRADDDGSTDAEDTGTPGDTSGAGACGELEACCDAIGADLYAGCITVVDMGNVDLCDSILATYHTEGYCTGEPYCDELGDCCPELPPGPGWQDTCWYYADLGNQPQCLMLIGDYQLSGYCE